MVGKARVQKRLYYKIGEACKELGIQPYVLRYWETEFPALTPSKSRSGQRVYSEKELEIIRRIKQLLYEEGYTIAGAKKKLEAELANGSLGEGDENGAVSEPATAAAPAAPPPAPAVAPAKNARRKAAEAPVAPVPEASAALDTDAAERIQTLRSGIEKALQEAREILALLDSK
jgi:DNA-binding transcriptional MerR regulator